MANWQTYHCKKPSKMNFSENCDIKSEFIRSFCSLTKYLTKFVIWQKENLKIFVISVKTICYSQMSHTPLKSYISENFKMMQYIFLVQMV